MSELEIQTKLEKIESRFKLKAFILFTSNMDLRKKFYSLLEKLHEANSNNAYFREHDLHTWKRLLEA